MERKRTSCCIVLPRLVESFSRENHGVRILRTLAMCFFSFVCLAGYHRRSPHQGVVPVILRNEPRSRVVAAAPVPSRSVSPRLSSPYLLGLLQVQSRFQRLSLPFAFLDISWHLRLLRPFFSIDIVVVMARSIVIALTQIFVSFPLPFHLAHTTRNTKQTA